MKQFFEKKLSINECEQQLEPISPKRQSLAAEGLKRWSIIKNKK